MIEKLSKPIRFDTQTDFLVVARDGEKFFVSDSDPSLNLSLEEMKPKTLLEFALVTNMPIRKFVRAQRVLSAKFFGT
jgi:hypothetical protein